MIITTGNETMQTLAAESMSWCYEIDGQLFSEDHNELQDGVSLLSLKDESKWPMLILVMITCLKHVQYESLMVPHNFFFTKKFFILQFFVYFC